MKLSTETDFSKSRVYVYLLCSPLIYFKIFRIHFIIGHMEHKERGRNLESMHLAGLLQTQQLARSKPKEVKQNTFRRDSCASVCMHASKSTKRSMIRAPWTFGSFWVCTHTHTETHQRTRRVKKLETKKAMKQSQTKGPGITMHAN